MVSFKNENILWFTSVSFTPHILSVKNKYANTFYKYTYFFTIALWNWRIFLEVAAKSIP